MPEHWIFAYGSLMWDPQVPVAETVVARADGYARSFCMRSIQYRGSVEAPGLVLGLDPCDGGACSGVALRFETVVFLIQPFVGGFPGVDGATLLRRDRRQRVGARRTHAVTFFDAGDLRPKNTGPDQWLPVMWPAIADRLLKRRP